MQGLDGVGNSGAAGTQTKSVTIAPGVVDPEAGDASSVSAGMDTAGDLVGSATSLLADRSAQKDAVVDAKQGEKAAKREAKEEERREVLARRQQDALQMLRNIPFVECRVIGTTKGSSGGSTFILYQVELSVPRDVFKEAKHAVQHRYSDFVALHDAAVKAWGRHVNLPKLPAKKITMTGLSPQQIEDRRLGLETYLAHLVTKLNWSVESNLRAFFEADRWLKERRTRLASSTR